MTPRKATKTRRPVTTRPINKTTKPRSELLHCDFKLDNGSPCGSGWPNAGLLRIHQMYAHEGRRVNAKDVLTKKVEDIKKLKPQVVEPPKAA